MEKVGRRRKAVRVLVYGTLGLATLVIFRQADRFDLLSERYIELRDAFQWPQPGYAVPTFDSHTVDGEEITVGERPGGRQLLFLFSPACEFSIASAPAWRELADAIARGHPDVQVIGIDVAGEGATAEYRDEHGFEFPVTTFPAPKLARLYRVRGTPLVVYLDHQGEVLYSRAGVLGEAAAIDSVAVAVREAVGRLGQGSAEGLGRAAGSREVTPLTGGFMQRPAENQSASGVSQTKDG